MGEQGPASAAKHVIAQKKPDCMCVHDESRWTLSPALLQFDSEINSVTDVGASKQRPSDSAKPFNFHGRQLCLPDIHCKLPLAICSHRSCPSSGFDSDDTILNGSLMAKYSALNSERHADSLLPSNRHQIAFLPAPSRQERNGGCDKDDACGKSDPQDATMPSFHISQCSLPRRANATAITKMPSSDVPTPYRYSRHIIGVPQIGPLLRISTNVWVLGSHRRRDDQLSLSCCPLLTDPAAVQSPEKDVSPLPQADDQGSSCRLGPCFGGKTCSSP